MKIDLTNLITYIVIILISFYLFKLILWHDSIGLVIDIDEMNIILSANIMTVKVTEELTQYLNVKFKWL